MGYVKQNFIDGQVLSASQLNKIEEGLTFVLGETKILTKSDFVNGTYSGTNLTTAEKNRIRTALIQVKKGDNCNFQLESGWTGYIATQKESNTSFSVRTEWLNTFSYTFIENCNFILVLRKDTGENITSENYNSNVEITFYETSDETSNEEVLIQSYFLEEIELTKEEIKSYLTEPCLIFPLLSDIHYKKSVEKPESIDNCINNIFKLSQEINFDFIACLGDVVEGDTSKEITQQYTDHLLYNFKKINVPYYQCIGNHDDNRYKTGESFTHAELYRNYIRNTKQVFFDNKTSMHGTNFYKDFDEFEIRCIFLNSNNNGSYGYSQDTYNWFVDVIENTTFKVIIFTHIDPNYGHNYGYKYGSAGYGSQILEVCNQYKEKIIILFSGHNHGDAVFGLEEENIPDGLPANNFLSFTINCQKFENENGDPNLWAYGTLKPFRQLNTYTEDCFDIIVVRPVEKKINRIRFGADKDTQGRSIPTEFLYN